MCQHHVRLRFHSDVAWLTKFPVSCDVNTIETVSELVQHIESRMFPIHCDKLLLENRELDLKDMILFFPHNTYIEWVEFCISVSSFEIKFQLHPLQQRLRVRNDRQWEELCQDSKCLHAEESLIDDRTDCCQ